MSPDSNSREYQQQKMVIVLMLFRTLIPLVGLSLLATFALAGGRSGLSSDIPDAQTLAVQRKVDALFDRGSFERAFFIYRKELAPLGDKYAQYMVGFMYETGLGIEKDLLRASAWYRIASERDTPEFIAVKERLMRYFTDEQISRSDVLFAALRLKFSDMAVMIQSISDDVHELSTRTGSRVRGEASPVAVISARTGNIRSGADYYGSIQKRLSNRLERLASIEGFEDIDTNPKTINVNSLKRRVREYLQNQPF